MPRMPVLERFADTGPQPRPVTLHPDRLQAMLAVARAEGAAAGRDEAATAATAENARQKAALSAHLQELSFSYHEARSHLLHALVPLLQTVCAAVLPQLARETLALSVAEALSEIIGDVLEPPVIISLPPAAMEPMCELLAAISAAPPLRLEPDPALGPASAGLRFDDQHLQIDLDSVQAAVARALHAFVETSKEPCHDLFPAD